VPIRFDAAESPAPGGATSSALRRLATTFGSASSGSAPSWAPELPPDFQNVKAPTAKNDTTSASPAGASARDTRLLVVSGSTYEVCGAAGSLYSTSAGGGGGGGCSTGAMPSTSSSQFGRLGSRSTSSDNGCTSTGRAGAGRACAVAPIGAMPGANGSPPNHGRGAAPVSGWFSRRGWDPWTSRLCVGS
jgi:hypothetical protein